MNLYWGDLHVHTSYSLDAYTAGNRNPPEQAYQFARGAPLPIAAGAGGTASVGLEEDLDFTAVTDHSEFLSVVGQCWLGAPGDPGTCEALADQGSTRQAVVLASYLARLLSPDPGPLPGCRHRGADECLGAERTAWAQTRHAADVANEPCEFTALIGYEWTGTTGGANLHRNVVFSSELVPADPADYLEHPSALDLWRALDEECRPDAGCDAITIPHNSNLSRGEMWDTADDDAVTRAYMARYQVLVEIYQHKAASECFPGDELADETCLFEANGDTDPEANAPGYVRNALGRGLVRRALDGTNPLALGIVGATDTHNGTPGYVAEDAWKGHLGVADDTPEKRLALSAFSPGALTGVWAQENTRAAIFAAFRRRETYATSGPRIPVRFYALAGVPSPTAAQRYCDDPTFPKLLVDAGAKPMGAEITAAGGTTLFIAASLDETPLRSFDIVRIGLDGGRPVVSRTEVVLPAEERGAFCRFVSAPEPTPARPALYYARVFQEETPRWSAYDCAAAPEVEGCTDGSIPDTVIERAWTSPIFVVPTSRAAL